MASCSTCIFLGLEPATEADAHRQGGRFVRVCILSRAQRPSPAGCASWARDPSETELPQGAFRAAADSARRAQRVQ